MEEESFAKKNSIGKDGRIKVSKKEINLKNQTSCTEFKAKTMVHSICFM